MSFPTELIDKILENETIYIAIQIHKYKILGVYNDSVAAKLKILENISGEKFNVDRYDPHNRYIKMNNKWFHNDIEEFYFSDLWMDLKCNDYEIHCYKKNEENRAHPIIYFNFNPWIVEQLEKSNGLWFQYLLKVTEEWSAIINKKKIPFIFNDIFSEKKLIVEDKEKNPLNWINHYKSKCKKKFY